MVFGQVCKVHFGSFWCFWEGDFMPILFLAGGDACFYLGRGLHLPKSRARLACVRVAAEMLMHTVMSAGNTQKKRELS